MTVGPRLGEPDHSAKTDSARADRTNLVQIDVVEAHVCLRLTVNAWGDRRHASEVQTTHKAQLHVSSDRAVGPVVDELPEHPNRRTVPKDALIVTYSFP